MLKIISISFRSSICFPDIQTTVCSEGRVGNRTGDKAFYWLCISYQNKLYECKTNERFRKAIKYSRKIISHTHILIHTETKRRIKLEIHSVHIKPRCLDFVQVECGAAAERKSNVNLQPTECGAFMKLWYDSLQSWGAEVDCSCNLWLAPVLLSSISTHPSHCNKSHLGYITLNWILSPKLISHICIQSQTSLKRMRSCSIVIIRKQIVYKM